MFKIIGVKSGWICNFFLNPEFYDICWSDPDDLIGSGSDKKGSAPSGSATLDDPMFPCRRPGGGPVPAGDPEASQEADGEWETLGHEEHDRHEEEAGGFQGGQGAARDRQEGQRDQQEVREVRDGFGREGGTRGGGECFKSRETFWYMKNLLEIRGVMYHYCESGSEYMHIIFLNLALFF